MTLHGVLNVPIACLRDPFVEPGPTGRAISLRRGTQSQVGRSAEDCDTFSGLGSQPQHIVLGITRGALYERIELYYNAVDGRAHLVGLHDFGIHQDNDIPLLEL